MRLGLTSYVHSNWIGEQPIWRSLFINYLLPLIVLITIQKYTPSLSDHYESAPISLVVICLLTIHTVLTVVAIVSINRRTRYTGYSYSASGNIALANLIVVFGFSCALVSLAHIAARFHFQSDITGVSRSQVTTTNMLPYYTPVDTENGIHMVSGSIESKATKRFKTYLETNFRKNVPVRQLVLNSDGGNIYEARGLAKLVRDNMISTHVADVCMSACTLVFVSGTRRTAEQRVQFGFHGYRLEGDHNQYLVDIDKEQQKDKDLFHKSNINSEFTESIYTTDHDDIWIPQLEDLLKANFLHEVID